MKFYSLDAIDRTEAQYRVIIGERSNGKTYAVLYRILENYVKTGKEGCYIRRWDEDLKGNRGASLFSAIAEDKHIERLTHGKYNSVYYNRRQWRLCKIIEGDRVLTDDKPFCWGFSITQMEHDKSTSYPNITTIFFDELLTRQMYLPNEFVCFMNVVSTIVRLRRDVVIYMAGNTVNKHCPYFAEMGLTHISEQKQGTIDVYTYGETELKVAVEYCSQMSKKGKPSDHYFAFGNSRLAMVTGGVWEMALYPHCPCDIKPKEITGNFFIEFDGYILQCDIIRRKDEELNAVMEFIFIHQKTTPIKNPGRDIIFTVNADARPNVISNITRAIYPFHRSILKMFAMDKVFYQNNEVGELVRNYFQTCQQMGVIKEVSR